MIEQYAKRNLTELDNQGGFYTRHLSAMTFEKLNGKSAIAAELAYRDMLINEMRNALLSCDDAMDYMSEYDIPLMLPAQVKQALKLSEV
ncbi:MAG: Shigella phage Sf11 [Pseudomonadota bacterium]|jgi:hypothetical protein